MTVHTLQVEHVIEIFLYRTASEINAFYAENKDGHQNGGKAIFGKQWHIALDIPLALNILPKWLYHAR